jgi:hypothetical protein
MKRTKPTQSAIAQKLQLELRVRFLVCWQLVLLEPSPRAVALLADRSNATARSDFLDQLPEFENGYTAAMVAGVERLLRNHLAFNGEFWIHQASL